METIKKSFIKTVIISMLVAAFASSVFAEDSKAKYYSEYLKQHPFEYVETSFPYKSRENITAEYLKEKQGYYIQNHKRFFQNPNRVPFILKLSEKDNVFSISQIDVQKGKEIIISKADLTQKGNTYEHSDYRLVKDGNTLFIYYEGPAPEHFNKYWTTRYPFVYQTNLKGLLDCVPVMKMTSDYLKKYEGRYYLDSYVINLEGNSYNFDGPKYEIKIHYDESVKSLVYDERTFTETDFDMPFYWLYAEGTGFHKKILTFAENGILCCDVYSTSYWGDNTFYTNDLLLYYVKDQPEIVKPARITTTNLRIRDKADLTDSKSLVSVKEGCEVTVTEIGKPDYIDRIIGNWVKVTVKKGSLDKDGKPIQKEITGWCFDGYLK